MSWLVIECCTVCVHAVQATCMYLSSVEKREGRGGGGVTPISVYGGRQICQGNTNPLPLQNEALLVFDMDTNGWCPCTSV